AASAVIGVLYALVDHDLKRLLAFHSIENIGIILLGIGSAVVFRTADQPTLALLGLTAALYHTVNHAAFKALLFLGAGAVVHATGTRNMEAMGGLVKRMPWTAACFFVGSASIAAPGVGLGLGPTLVVPVFGAVAASVLAGAAAPVTLGDWLTLRMAGGYASLSTLAIAIALGGALLIPLVALPLARASRRTRDYETWGCGRIVQTARMEYTATAFANPFKRVFDFFYRPTKRLDIEFHPESRFFVERIEYENPTRSIFHDWLYRPALDLLRAGTRVAGAAQSGSPNLYLAYILAALLL